MRRCPQEETEGVGPTCVGNHRECGDQQGSGTNGEMARREDHCSIHDDPPTDGLQTGRTEAEKEAFREEV